MVWDPTKPPEGGDLISAEIRANWEALAPLLTLIPAGTRMLFDQLAAPAGWTRDTTINDRAVRIVSGGTVGNAGSSWTISGLTHVHTHTMGNHVHNHAHTHTVNPPVTLSDYGDSQTGVSNFAGTNINTNIHRHNVDIAVFTSGAESVTATGVPSNNTTDGANTTAVASDGSWRPLTRDLIVATKN